MPLSSIVLQQLKHDAPYAWFLRDQASISPIFRKNHVAELDSRLEAYLNCFLVSHKGGKSLLPMLKPSAWGAIFVRAIVSLRTSDTDAFTETLDLVKQPAQSKELSDALCWVGIGKAQRSLSILHSHENPLVRIAAITAGGYFTRKIEAGFLHTYLDDEPGVVVATLKVIGQNKIISCSDKLEKLLKHDDEDVRFHAAYAGCLLKLNAAYSVLQEFCFTENSHLRTALGMLYHIVDDGQIRTVVDKIHASPYSPRIKAYNIAMAGMTSKIPTLLEWMSDPEYAPLAGEAFSFITGADIEEDDLSILDVEICESQETPLAQKRKQDHWTEAYESDLPWPEPGLVKQWWQGNKSRFQDDKRYLAGKTLETDNLEFVLEHGTQPQRRQASLVLAINNPEMIVRDVSFTNRK